jgi:hypothetical protein
MGHIQKQKGNLKMTVEKGRKKVNGKPLHLTRRFGEMAAVARRKFSANLEVCRPPEVQWKPPLRQAAGTLCESGGLKKLN